MVDKVIPGEVDYTKIVWDNHIDFINFLYYFTVVVFVLLHI